MLNKSYIWPHLKYKQSFNHSCMLHISRQHIDINTRANILHTYTSLLSSLFTIHYHCSFSGHLLTRLLFCSAGISSFTILLLRFSFVLLLKVSLSITFASVLLFCHCSSVPPFQISDGDTLPPLSRFGSRRQHGGVTRLPQLADRRHTLQSSIPSRCQSPSCALLLGLTPSLCAHSLLPLSLEARCHHVFELTVS